MSWSKAFPVLLAAGILSLLIPLSLVLAQGGTGTVTIMDSDENDASVNLSNKATINIMDVPSLPAGQVYEGWFVTNPDVGDRKQSTGILNVDDNGMIDHTLILMSGDQPSGENLFAAFDKFVVTIEPDPDDDPGPSDQIALIYVIPEGSIAHIRHLVFSSQGNPEYASGFHQGTPKGITVGLRDQSRTALLHANLAKDSANLAEVQQHAEHVVHIIEGSAGPNAGDLNNSGQAENPGDGIGVLSYAANAGDRAGLAVTDAPGDAEIAMNARGVMASTGQVAMWAEQARDMSLQVLNTQDFDVASLIAVNAAAILERSLNGFDANGNGTIERITGEGGAMQAYWAAQAMGTYTLAEPAPEPTPEPTPAPPKTGDIVGGASYPSIALVALVIGAFILVGGLFAFRLTRRRAY